MMPTAERRFYLGLLVQQRSKEKEAAKQNKQTGKGRRQTTVSGEALKTKMLSGEIPA